MFFTVNDPERVLWVYIFAGIGSIQALVPPHIILIEAVGGSSKSQHCKGEAVDIECPGTSNYQVAKWIEDTLDFDQLILEFYTPGIPDSGWVHVSYKSEGNRKSVLTAMKENGKTVYKPGLIE